MSLSVSVGVDVVVWVFPRTVGRLEGVCGGGGGGGGGEGGPGQRVCGSDDLLVRGETFGV